MCDITVFDIAFHLHEFHFITWLQLSRVNKFYYNYFGKMFVIWKKNAEKRLIDKVGSLGDNLFCNNFHLCGSFLLDLIYGTTYANDVDIIQNDEISKGKSLDKLRLSTTNTTYVCDAHNLTFNDCNVCQNFNQNYEWDALEKIRDFIDPDIFYQYPPGYSSNPEVYIVETYKAAHPKDVYIDAITIMCEKTTKDFVSEFDFAFCRVLYDGKSLFIADFDSFITKTCKFGIEEFNNNLNNFHYDEDSDRNHIIHILDRIGKYKKRGFDIQITKNVCHKMIIKCIDNK